MSTVEQKDVVSELMHMSRNIKGLYEKLTAAEFEFGVEHEEYKRLLDAIDMSVEYENELKAEVFSSEKLTLDFLESVNIEGDQRFAEMMNNDPEMYLPILKAKKSEVYDRILSRGIRLYSKEQYMAREYDPYVMDVLFKGAITMLFNKTYVEQLDAMIKKSNKLDDKLDMMRDKYGVLCTNPALESWYFGNFRRTEALFDTDTQLASYVGLPKESFTRLKTNHFEELVRNMELLTFSMTEESDDQYRLLELYLLVGLLNLDEQEAYDLYNEFYANCRHDEIPFDNSRFMFINKVYNELSSIREDRAKKLERDN